MSAQLPSLADAPGTAREYETIYILRPGCTNDQVAEVNGRVRTIIEERGGKVLKVDNWGKRRLAYEVSTERKGIYLYWQYLAGPGVVQEFERNMRMLDSVIRYMTVKLDADVDPEARPSEADDEAFERAANTAADEEDLYLHRGEGEGEGEDGDEGDDDGDGDGETVEAAVEAAAEGDDSSKEAASAEEKAEAPASDEASSSDDSAEDKE